MVKRKGANGRKKTSERRARQNTHRKVPFAALLFVAIAVAGCIVIGRYGHRLLSLVHSFDWSKSAVARQVVIQGAVQVNPDELLKRSGITFPITLEQLKKAQLIALQNASPWIDKIKITGIRDGKITLCISERKPVALLQSGSIPSSSQQAGAIYLVDACGVCLPLGHNVEYPLPLISGLKDSVGNDGIRRITAAGVSRMDRFFRDAAAADNASFAKRITQLNFGRAPVLRAMVEGSATVVVINENDIAGCIEKYTGIWETVRNDSLEPLRIDLAYRNLAFVTPKTVPQPVGAGESIAKKTKG
jgi:hypothetical protein